MAEDSKHSLSHRVSESQKSENDVVGWFSSEPLMGLPSIWQPGLQASHSSTGSGFAPKVAPGLAGPHCLLAPALGFSPGCQRGHTGSWPPAEPALETWGWEEKGGRETTPAAETGAAVVPSPHLRRDTHPSCHVPGKQVTRSNHGEGPAGREHGEGSGLSQRPPAAAVVTPRSRSRGRLLASGPSKREARQSLWSLGLMHSL